MALQVYFSITVDGMEVISHENTNAQSYNDVEVFAGDNFRSPADASYKNLSWEKL